MTLFLNQDFIQKIFRLQVFTRLFKKYHFNLFKPQAKNQKGFPKKFQEKNKGIIVTHRYLKYNDLCFVFFLTYIKTMFIDQGGYMTLNYHLLPGANFN